MNKDSPHQNKQNTHKNKIKHGAFQTCVKEIKWISNSKKERIRVIDSFLLLFFLTVLGFEITASCLLGRPFTTWTTPPALLCFGCLRDRVERTICPGWLLPKILLMCTSWVARITGMSHQYPPLFFYMSMLISKFEINTNLTLVHTRMCKLTICA
jgi:hypothetical protein